MSSNGKDASNRINWTQVIVAALGVISAVGVAYLGYLQVVVPRQLEIQSAQTAEAITVSVTSIPKGTPLPPASISTPIPIYTPIAAHTPPTTTIAGARWCCDKADAVYVFVPAGDFTMGSSNAQVDEVMAFCTDCDRSWFAVEYPDSDVYLDGFWIMQTEVTNAQYRNCVEADACTEEAHNDRWHRSAYADHPVTNVTWFQANDYATWVGGRLPTEAEWEKACRGADGRIYPWGSEEPNEGLANFGGNMNDTTSVGSYSPRGNSPYGVVDMAGNVWEWTSSKYDQEIYPYPYKPDDGRENLGSAATRTLRGGSFRNIGNRVRCAYRGRFGPTKEDDHYGFRLVTNR